MGRHERGAELVASNAAAAAFNVQAQTVLIENWAEFDTALSTAAVEQPARFEFVTNQWTAGTGSDDPAIAAAAR